MAFEGFSFLKKKEAPTETPVEQPVQSEEEIAKEELAAGFDLRIKMLKGRIERMGEKNTGIEESTMAGVEEDLEMLKNIIKEAKNDKSFGFLEKLTGTLTGLNESVNTNPNDDKSEAYAKVKQFILDVSDNNLG
jgi:hypothetical protein